jgi:hypothetical protein
MHFSFLHVHNMTDQSHPSWCDFIPRPQQISCVIQHVGATALRWQRALTSSALWCSVLLFSYIWHCWTMKNDLGMYLQETISYIIIFKAHPMLLVTSRRLRCAGHVDRVEDKRDVWGWPEWPSELTWNKKDCYSNKSQNIRAYGIHTPVHCSK